MSESSWSKTVQETGGTSKDYLCRNGPLLVVAQRAWRQRQVESLRTKSLCHQKAWPESCRCRRAPRRASGYVVDVFHGWSLRQLDDLAIRVEFTDCFCRRGSLALAWTERNECSAASGLILPTSMLERWFPFFTLCVSPLGRDAQEKSLAQLRHLSHLRSLYFGFGGRDRGAETVGLMCSATCRGVIMLRIRSRRRRMPFDDLAVMRKTAKGPDAARPGTASHSPHLRTNDLRQCLSYVRMDEGVVVWLFGRRGATDRRKRPQASDMRFHKG